MLIHSKWPPGTSSGSGSQWMSRKRLSQSYLIIIIGQSRNRLAQAAAAATTSWDKWMTTRLANGYQASRQATVLVYEGWCTCFQPAKLDRKDPTHTHTNTNSWDYLAMFYEPVDCCCNSNSNSDGRSWKVFVLFKRLEHMGGNWYIKDGFNRLLLLLLYGFFGLERIRLTTSHQKKHTSSSLSLPFKSHCYSSIASN